MKKFVIRLLCLLVGVLFLLFLLKKSVPFYWGDENLAFKTEYFLENKEDFNAVFIGHSMMQSNLLPKLFDKCVNDGGTSYNLGVGAMNILETEYYIENLVENDLGSVETIFVLASIPKGMIDQYYHTVKSKYFLNARNVSLVNGYFNDTNAKNLDVKKTKYRFTTSYLENLFGFGEIKSIIKYHLGIKTKNYLGEEPQINQNGYIPMKGRRVKDQEAFAKFLKTQKRFHLKSLKMENKELQHLVSIYTRIHNLCVEKNIECVFVHLPNSKLMPYLTELNNIHLGSPQEFPEYYDAKYRFDRVGHVNKDGAKMFTNRFCKLYKKYKFNPSK